MAATLLTADLVTSSRVDGAAQRCGVSLRAVSTAAEVIAACAESLPSLVLVDLTAPALDIAALVVEMKALDPRPTIVAFGPHVHEALLAAARAAGCDQVASRGQFFAQLDGILRQRR